MAGELRALLEAVETTSFRICECTPNSGCLDAKNEKRLLDLASAVRAAMGRELPTQALRSAWYAPTAGGQTLEAEDARRLRAVERRVKAELMGEEEGMSNERDKMVAALEALSPLRERIAALEAENMYEGGNAKDWHDRTIEQLKRIVRQSTFAWLRSREEE